MKIKGMILTASALVCAICVIMFTSISSKAETDIRSDAPECCYLSVRIQEGDTLDKISDRYNTSGYYTKQEYIDMVKRINRLYSDNIHAGCFLTVACYD